MQKKLIVFHPYEVCKLYSNPDMTDVIQETVSQMNVKVKDWHAEQGRFLFFARVPSLHCLVPKLCLWE